MTSKTVSKPRWEQLFAELRSLGLQIDGEDVSAYLNEFPDIASVLTPIASSTRKEFGPDAPLSLRLYRDPEIDNKFLLLSIAFPDFDPDIMRRIDLVADAHEDQRRDKKGEILLFPDFPRTR